MTKGFLKIIEYGNIEYIFCYYGGVLTYTCIDSFGYVESQECSFCFMDDTFIHACEMVGKDKVKVTYSKL